MAKQTQIGRLIAKLTAERDELDRMIVRLQEQQAKPAATRKPRGRKPPMNLAQGI